jgi:hypothetical protein
MLESARTFFAVPESECSQSLGNLKEQVRVLWQRTATSVDTELKFATPLSNQCLETGGLAVRWRRHPSQLPLLAHIGPICFSDLHLAKHPVSIFSSATCVGLSVPWIMHNGKRQNSTSYCPAQNRCELSCRIRPSPVKTMNA